MSDLFDCFSVAEQGAMPSQVAVYGTHAACHQRLYATGLCLQEGGKHVSIAPRVIFSKFANTLSHTDPQLQALRCQRDACT